MPSAVSFSLLAGLTMTTKVRAVALASGWPSAMELRSASRTAKRPQQRSEAREQKSSRHHFKWIITREERRKRDLDRDLVHVAGPFGQLPLILRLIAQAEPTSCDSPA